MVKNNANEPGRRPSEDADGNAMGLTEAFHPVASDGFTTVMKPAGEAGSVESEEVTAGPAGTFEEVDLGDGEPLDDEGLAAGESFGNEEAFDDFYAGRPAHGRGEGELSAATPLPTISHGATTKPASKAKGEGPRHGRHAHVATDNQGKPAVPEYMRKSRRMRRILIAVIAVLVLLLGGLSYFGVQLYKENSSTAVQQAQNTEHEPGTIQSDQANDASTETAKTTTVPNLVGLLGLTQQEAVDKLQHGAQVSSSREVNEEGNPIKTEARVALTAEPSDGSTNTPTVYLGLNAEGKIVQAGYSASTSSLGYGSLSFADAVSNEDIIQKTLAEAGVPVPGDAVSLPEDPASYTTFDSDGKTRTKEYCSFSGTVDLEGVAHTWSAVLSYDYSMANASGNLADTVRTIFIYVNA
ncbi:histone-lysine N-methyltransferase [Adlercreutzia mucosicola]|uniref:histone-lysine N-methyltransferase n=1 Tax=Adlercreutzia mucosicola TaxID=580026 RepID=UPI00214C11AD|nr:histone-lysine N-methyltransferase [Adlercreutzia mucosicola]MCR2036293.1 histone-lysine N-methyltransferase [Adlercreutzia mucosicola]